MSLKTTLLSATLITALSAPAYAESVKIGVPTWTGAQAIAHLLAEVVESRIGGEAELVPGKSRTGIRNSACCPGSSAERIGR